MKRPNSRLAVHPPRPLAVTPWGAAFSALLALVVLFACAPFAAADGIIIPRPPIDRPIPWREVPLAIKYHRVTVTIEEQVAVTRVDQLFVNEAPYQVEGVYVFPLPADAAISSFDMWVDGRKLEGRLLGRDEARAFYEEIVRRERDPALLEYVGRGAFQVSIFPIPAGGQRRIELAYSQVLSQTDGLVHYRYPLNTEKFSARNLEDVSVTVNVAERAPIRAIYSPSHPVQVTRPDAQHATVSYEARDVRPDRDFDLYYSLSSEAVAVNLLSYKPYDEDGFFLLLVAPPLSVEADLAVPKDVVLVLDTSGSMDGDKIAQARSAAEYVLDHLGPADRFNIVAFSTATRLFAERPVPADQRQAGKQFVAALMAAGSTDINRALLEALAGADPKRPTVLIFLTDGLPTVGETDPDRIVANARANAPRAVRLFAFGVGYDVDVTLLDALSSGLRGTSTYVQPGQKIDEAVSELYARISAPVLVDVQLAFEGVHVEDIYPYPLPDLFAGSQLMVVGRYRRGGTATLRLTGNMVVGPGSEAVRTYTYRDLRFVERGGNEFIPRLWAQRKIGYLLTQIRLQSGHAGQQELIREVIELAIRYGTVTPYTSFLVEEPTLALSSAGREQLNRDLQTPRPPALAVPAAPSLLMPDRSGAAAVEKAATEKALRESELPAEAAAGTAAGQTVRHVGDKTFVWHQGAWVDTRFDADNMVAETVLFGSPRYFELLERYPDIGPYLALGDRVTVVVAGAAFAITPGAVPGEPDRPQAALTPVPSAPEGPGDRPVATVTPALPSAPEPPALPALCPVPALIGLAGVSMAVLGRRRLR